MRQTEESGNKEKAQLMDALRNDYPLKDLFHCVKMISSYFYQRSRLLAEDKYGPLKISAKALSEENGGRYGYRRMYALLLGKTDGRS